MLDRQCCMRLREELVQPLVNHLQRGFSRQVVQGDVTDDRYRDPAVRTDHVRSSDFRSSENIELEYVAAANSIDRVDRFLKQGQIFLG